MAGYPLINVTAGFTFGLPVGISFMAGAFSEPTLIKLASGFEHVVNPRQAPKFLPPLKLPTRNDPTAPVRAASRAAGPRRLELMAERLTPRQRRLLRLL